MYICAGDGNFFFFFRKETNWHYNIIPLDDERQITHMGN